LAFLLLSDASQRKPDTEFKYFFLDRRDFLLTTPDKKNEGVFPAVYIPYPSLYDSMPDFFLIEDILGGFYKPASQVKSSAIMIPAFRAYRVFPSNRIYREAGDISPCIIYFEPQTIAIFPIVHRAHPRVVYFLVTFFSQSSSFETLEFLSQFSMNLFSGVGHDCFRKRQPMGS
jgi:hypothetical protein